MDAVEFVSDLPGEAPSTLPSTYLPMSSPPTPVLMMSSRPMIGQRTETLFQNASLNNSMTSHQDQILSYHTALQTNCETAEYNG